MNNRSIKTWNNKNILFYEQILFIVAHVCDYEFICLVEIILRNNFWVENAI